MNNQKIENLLNLALDATEKEREQSLNLDVGYEEENNTWIVIVKYHGSIERLDSRIIKVEPLIAGYAIITVPENLLDALAEMEEIEYIEKPKRLFFQVLNGKRASCIFPVTAREPFLTGKGVLIGIIDTGIDFFLPAFQTIDGKSRIQYLLDQTLDVEYNNEQLNQEIAKKNEAQGAGSGENIQVLSTFENGIPGRDISGHGTAVAGIAAGFEWNGTYSGVAPESELIVVKLGQPKENSFPTTVELMKAFTFCVQKAIELKKPIAINVSYGNTYGAHDGTSLLERFTDNVAEIYKTVICVGSGNEGASGGHAGGNVVTETKTQLAVGKYERALSVQLWTSYSDEYEFKIQSPGGEMVNIEINRQDTIRIGVENTNLLIYVGEPSPYSMSREVYIDMLPADTYITEGVWTFILIPVQIVTGRYNYYLPSAQARGNDTRFFEPTPDLTLTIPSSSNRVITVGAYDVIYNSYADFSGRGKEVYQDKPDIVAPGVNVMVIAPGGQFERVNGTSFATPFVTGSAALMMEWGIVRGNDQYLYGDKVKAYLIRGARKLPEFNVYPNAQVGWGALCLSDSLPI